MRKLIIVCTFLLAFLSSTLTFAGFFGDGEVGYVPECDGYYAELTVGYRWNISIAELEAYGGYYTLVTHLTPMWFSPYRETYTAGGELKIGCVTFSIKHQCSHGVHSEWTHFYNYYMPPASQTKLGIGFEFETGGR